MNTQKRTYSINLAAYIALTAELLPTIKLDEATNTFYWEFPDCGGTSLCIENYKAGTAIVNLRKFQAMVRTLKNDMAQAKGE